MKTSSNLCVDFGNSRVKAAYFNDNELVKQINVTHTEAGSALKGMMERYKPKACIVSSVVELPEELLGDIEAHCVLVSLDSRVNLPFMNAYHQPEGLGPDRLALVAGLQAQYPNENALVICAGTAITYNFLQNGKIFRGGGISPGIQLRLRALKDYTAKLPLVEARRFTPLLGHDTVTSIRSGVVWGVAAEIEGMIDYYEQEQANKRVILTGGDLDLFADKLKKEIFADSEILMKGLNIILNKNV